MTTSRFPRRLIQTLPLLALAVGAIAIQGCAHPQTMNHNAFLTLREAGYTRAHNEEWAEAYAIAVLLEDADSSDPKVEALKSAALKKKPALRALESRKWLGGNHAMRTENWPTPVISAILLYPVNLLGDIADLASGEIGLGIGIGAKAKVTEVAALGAQAEMGEALLGWRGGRPTAYKTVENSLDFLTLNFRSGVYPGDRMYDGIRIPYATDGLKQPGEPPYDFVTDYYGIGAHVMAGLFVFNFEVHPVQLFDAVAGLLLIDPLNDNYVVNQKIVLSEEEKEAAGRLFE